jgi:hypothetical protein
MTSAEEIIQAIDVALTALNGHHVEAVLSVQSVRFHLMCDTGFFLSDDDGPMFGRFQFTGETPGEVIAQAKAGDKVAHEALCYVAENLTDRGESLPNELGKYVLEFARGKRPNFRRGRSGYENIYRDFHICVAVRRVVKMGYDATRNAETRGSESACAIVAKASEETKFGDLTEHTINEIWKHRARQYFDRP